MKLFNTLVRDNDSDLLSLLRQNGFSPNQAQRFIMPAVTGLISTAKQMDLSSLLSMTSQEQLTRLTAAMDIPALSAQTGVDRVQACNGLEALLPKVMETIKGPGGLLGGLNKMLG